MLNNNQFSLKLLAATILGCQPDELLGFRQLELGGVVVITPNGQKIRLGNELLEEQAARMGSPRALSPRGSAMQTTNQTESQPQPDPDKPGILKRKTSSPRPGNLPVQADETGQTSLSGVKRRRRNSKSLPVGGTQAGPR